MSAAVSILGVLYVLVPVPLFVLQVVGAVLLARRLPSGARRSLGVAAFAVGALETLVWLATNAASQLAPTLQADYHLAVSQISVVLGLLNWIGALVGTVALILVVLALVKLSARSEHRTW